MRVRSPCGILRAARQEHAHALLWCGVADSGFCDRGDCEVTLFCSALCHTRAAPFPKGQRDPTSTCQSCVDQPRVSGRMIPERSLSSPCREKKDYSGPRSLVSPCRNPHDTVWVLCGVSATVLQTRTVPHTRAQSAYTHLTLGSMSELFAARQGRSAWEPALPLGQNTC